MAIKSLADRLTPEQAQASFASTLKEATDRSDPAQMLILGSVMQSIAPKLMPEQAQVALAAVMGGMSSTVDLTASQALALAVEPLARALAGKPAAAMLMAVLSQIQSGFDDVELSALASAVRPLANSLTAEQTRAAMSVIFKGVMTTPTGPRARALRIATEGLSSALTVDQAKEILMPLFQSLVAEASNQPQVGTLKSFSQIWLALQAVPGNSTEKQPQVALGPLLKSIAEGDPASLPAQASAVGILAEKMTAEQAQTALSAVLKAMSNTMDPTALEFLATAVDQLAPRLTDDARRQGADSARSILAWSQSLPSAIEGATALVTLLSHESAERRVFAIVEALKYPTAVGQTTGLLLKALQEAGAPGPDESFDANLSWVAKTYPSIDLDAPPSCPPPPRAGLVCPSPSR